MSNWLFYGHCKAMKLSPRGLVSFGSVNLFFSSGQKHLLFRHWERKQRLFRSHGGRSANMNCGLEECRQGSASLEDISAKFSCSLRKRNGLKRKPRRELFSTMQTSTHCPLQHRKCVIFNFIGILAEGSLGTKVASCELSRFEALRYSL